jgi:hypothetical protein
VQGGIILQYCSNDCPDALDDDKTWYYVTLKPFSGRSQNPVYENPATSTNYKTVDGKPFGKAVDDKSFSQGNKRERHYKVEELPEMVILHSIDGKGEYEELNRWHVQYQSDGNLNLESIRPLPRPSFDSIIVVAKKINVKVYSYDINIYNPLPATMDVYRSMYNFELYYYYPTLERWFESRNFKTWLLGPPAMVCGIVLFFLMTVGGIVSLFLKLAIKDFSLESLPIWGLFVGSFLIIYGVLSYLCYKIHISFPFLFDTIVSLLALSFSSTAAGIILLLLKLIHMGNIGSGSV